MVEVIDVYQLHLVALGQQCPVLLVVAADCARKPALCQVEEPIFAEIVGRLFGLQIFIQAFAIEKEGFGTVAKQVVLVGLGGNVVEVEQAFDWLKRNKF